jgi:hypothetical protein
MYCLFVFTSSCLYEGSCCVCSSLPPVICRKADVVFVRLYLQLAVLQSTGGKDEQTRNEPSYRQLEVKTNKHNMNPPTNNWR